MHLKAVGWIKAARLLLFFLSACAKNYHLPKDLPKDILLSEEVPAEKVPAPVSETLQRYGRGINECNHQGRTPLLEAIENRDLENVATLLKHPKHDLKAVEWKALSKAIGNYRLLGSPEILQLLLAAGADINARDESGATPLQRAVDFEKVEMLKQLLATANIDVNAQQENDGHTALHTAALCNQKEAFSLLLNKVGLNIQDKKGQTPLHLCAAHNRDDLGEKLLKAEANPNIQDNEGQTPLHFCVLKGHNGLGEKLLKAKADPNIQDNKGQTPLSIAVGKSYPEYKLIEALLVAKEKKADVDIKIVSSGDTVLQLALYNFPDSSVVMRGRGINLATMQKLIASTNNINTKNSNGETALHTFVKLGTLNLDVFNCLIQARADVNAQDNQGMTPLHILCNPSNLFFSSKCESICEILLAKGANPSLQAKDEECSSALDYARSNTTRHKNDIVNNILEMMEKSIESEK